MQKLVTSWPFLAVLALPAICALNVLAGEGPENKDASRPLPPEVAKAWRDAGADLGWMKDLPPKSSGYQFWEPWRKKSGPGAMPAFRFPERDAAGVLAKLPDPGTAFGLDFHCGFYAGVSLKELAGLKNLQSLNIGGVQGNTYADLKDLAGSKNLRGLYLFYSGVTDAQLKHLAALKNLQTLDLSNTSVTDVGLKELAGLTCLQALNLHSTEVTDAGLKVLGGLKGLQTLHLGETAVTDAGLKELAGLKNLQVLNLRDTKTTAEGAAALRKELPACKIIGRDD
jgi:internalin A